MRKEELENRKDDWLANEMRREGQPLDLNEGKRIREEHTRIHQNLEEKIKEQASEDGKKITFHNFLALFFVLIVSIGISFSIAIDAIIKKASLNIIFGKVGLLLANGVLIVMLVVNFVKNRE